jgi:hypothetical protein
LKVNAIFGAGVAGKSYVVTRQRRLNCYYENREDKDKSPIAVYGTPGLALAGAIGTNVGASVRGMIGNPNNLFAVVGGIFYQLSPNLSTFYSLPIGTNFGLVSLATNTNNAQVALVDGTSGYIFTAGALVPIVSAGFPNGAKTITFASGNFVAEKPNSQQFQVSATFDGTTWNPLAFASASQYSDLLLAVDSLIGNLLLFCGTHLEFWQSVGTVPQPYAPILSATVEYGLAAIFSRVHVDNSIIFLARSQQGGVKVCRIQGYQVTPISTPDLEAIFATFPTVADCTGLSYDADKHPMAQLTFPSAGRSFLYDCSTGIWSETQTGLTQNYAARHLGNLATFFNGKQYVADSTTNNLYVPSATQYTDNGAVIKREIITRHQLKDFNLFSIGELYIDIETGVGLTTGQGSNPVVGLECSKDNGRTWLTQRTKTIGMQGQYNSSGQRLHFNRWGSSRVFTFRLCMTDPVKFALTAGATSDVVRPQ